MNICCGNPTIICDFRKGLGNKLRGDFLGEGFNATGTKKFAQGG
jgi:hypothetical protein